MSLRVKKKDRLRWYLVSLVAVLSNGETVATAHPMAVTKWRVTKADLDSCKDTVIKAIPSARDAVVQSVSYLGHMTETEFLGAGLTLSDA